MLPEDQNNLNDVKIYFEGLLNEVASDSIKNNAEEMTKGVNILVTKSKGLFIYASMAGEKLKSSKRNGEDVTF